MNGVIILCLNEQQYACAAFNLAASIKHYNKNIHITLVSDGIHRNVFDVKHFWAFDNIKEIQKEDFNDVNGFAPAKAKLNIYKYATRTNNMYIDADAICVGDLGLLFEKLKGNTFKSNVLAQYTTWCSPETYKSFFDVENTVTINSSFIYFENDEVFKLANQYYAQGFKREDLIQKWGLRLPDEMFFNAAISKLRINAKTDFNTMFLDDKRVKFDISALSDYFLLSFHGNKHSTRLLLQEYYDRAMYKILNSLGLEHRFKIFNILAKKLVNQK